MNITKELQDFLTENPSIKKIYFDKSGRHYFNVHELISDSESKERKLFGSGVYSHKQVIPGKTNVDNLKEIVAKGNPDTEIVKTITRKDVLDFEVKSNEESFVSQILKLSPSEKLSILAALGLSVEDIKTEKETPPSPPVKAK